MRWARAVVSIAGPLVPKTVMRSILGQAPGVDERAIDLGYPSDFGEDGGGRPPASADVLPDTPADAGPGGDPPGPGPGSDRLRLSHPHPCPTPQPRLPPAVPPAGPALPDLERSSP